MKVESAPDVDDAGELRILTLNFSHREIDRLYSLAVGNKRAIEEDATGELACLPAPILREELQLMEALVKRLAEAWDQAFEAVDPEAKEKL